MELYLTLLSALLASVAQFILENYVPLHADLRKLNESHFDAEFLKGFKAGRPVLTEVHPYIFMLKCVLCGVDFGGLFGVGGAFVASSTGDHPVPV